MGLKENGIQASGVFLMGKTTRASWNQYDVGGRSIGNRIMFGMYVSRPVGYYDKAVFLPFSYGGAAVRLSGSATQSITIEALGDMATAASINGVGTPVFNGNEGWHIFANLSGEGVIDTANPSDSRGSLECTVEIGSRPSAFDIAQAVLNAGATDYNIDGTIGNKINSAGTSGDPWSGVMSGYTDNATFGAFVKKLLTTGKFLGLK